MCVGYRAVEQKVLCLHLQRFNGATAAAAPQRISWAQVRAAPSPRALGPLEGLAQRELVLLAAHSQRLLLARRAVGARERGAVDAALLPGHLAAARALAHRHVAADDRVPVLAVGAHEEVLGLLLLMDDVPFSSANITSNNTGTVSASSRRCSCGLRLPRTCTTAGTPQTSPRTRGRRRP